MEKVKGFVIFLFWVIIFASIFLPSSLDLWLPKGFTN